TVAEGCVDLCCRIRRDHGVNKAVLSGGVFQNTYLLSIIFNSLDRAGFEVYVHRVLPPNDGCISLGQAAVAGAGLS
ncbi:MAG: hypothetical protein ACOCSE_01460, partial [Chitinivibrionales bacterium]